MNRTLINNWNSVVTDEDDVYVLGDFAFRFKTHLLLDTLYRLAGTKYLIVGNHDKPLIKKGLYKYAPITIYNDPIILNGFTLSHRPLAEAIDFDFINIHGHIHELRKDDPHYINVCVEQTNYTPIEFWEAVKHVA